jgi:hypothetical protein
VRAKRLEVLLGSGLGIGDAEMVHRFQKLRDHCLLPLSRGRNADDITIDAIVSGVLSVVDARPGFAGLAASTLRDLRPVGTPDNAFAQAPTLAAALRAALDDDAVLTTITEIRLTSGEVYPQCFGRAAIFYHVAGGEERVTYFVGKTAVSLFKPGKEADYDPRDLISSMIRETTIFPDILKEIAREAKGKR